MFRAQSAMEYLMTYSWAIMIVAIVLAGLYALGVFSPGNVLSPQCVLPAGLSCTSITMASNGLLIVNLQQTTLSEINITAYGCNANTTTAHMQRPYNPPSNQVSMQIGANYTFSVQCWAGASPLSSSVGKTFTGYFTVNYTNTATGFPSSAQGQLVAQTNVYSQPVTVSSSTTTYQSSTTTYQSSSSSTLSSTTTYQSSSSSTLSSTTTYAATTTTPATTTIHYLVVTLSNSQGTATSSNFQQMVQFVPSSYSSYEASDLGNIRFFTGNVNTGTGELHSWCETNCTSGASGQTLFWINLGSSVVPASGTLQINMSFEPTSTEYDAIYAGEAPQLSSTYGQYDNGASVFKDYANFAGTSLPSNLATDTYGGCGTSYTVNQGITLSGCYSGTGGTLDLYFPLETQAVIAETYMTSYSVTGSGSPQAGVYEAQSLTIPTQKTPGEYSYATDFKGSTPVYFEYADTGSLSTASTASVSLPLNIGIGWFATGDETYYYGGSTYSPGISVGSFGNYYAGIFALGGSTAAATASFTWFRTRIAPPGGVMPGYSFSSVQ